MQPSRPLPTHFIDFNSSYVESLARDNNFNYTQAGPIEAGESGLYANEVTQTTKLHRLSFMVEGLACEYYTAQYIPVIVTNSPFKALNDMTPSNIPPISFFTQVFAVRLPYQVEDLYVESRTNITLNNILGLSSVVFKQSRRIDLEGDFNDFFHVYVPEHEELTAFTILAPNIMAKLLSDGGDYDFEFSGNKVYFYQTFSYYTEGKITLRKKQYNSLLKFGIESTQTMARAGRPTHRPENSVNTPMWKLYGMSNAKFYITFALVLSGFFFAFLCFFVPLLWPLAIPIALFGWAKYRRLRKKRTRLAREWQARSVAS